MPRSETVLQVFVASPSDVRDEREILESVVAELNRTWATTLNVRLELVRWETHSHPAIGNDAQEIINAQIGDVYDVFIGILWGRIGSPTPRAESGTLEEFERAYSRWQSDPESLEVMFYFKDAPIKPSDCDGRQLDKVQAFRNALGEQGVYHWTFEGTDNFESLVRAHLSAVAQRWGPVPATAAKYPDTGVPKENLLDGASDSEDDLGFLDYMDRFDFSMEQMNNGFRAIADATASVGEHMNRRTAELQEIGDINDPQRYKNARRTIRSSAEDMVKFAEILDVQLPLLSSSRKDAFESISRALSLRKEFDGEDRADIEKLDSALRSMIEAGGGSVGSMEGLRTTVRELPRLTSDLNKAKRRVVKSLDQVCSEIEATIRTAKSLLGSL